MRALILIAALLAPAPAAAQVFDGRCNFHSQGMNFGPYSSLDQAPNTTIGQIEVTCNRVEAVQTVQIFISAGNSGQPLDRFMSRGRNDLRYNIYTDPGHHRVAGDGSNGTVAPIRILRDPGRATFRLFGKIPPGQPVREGDYDDRLRVTIEF